MSRGAPVPKRLVTKRGLHGSVVDIPEVRPALEHGISQWGISDKSVTYFMPLADEKQHADWTANYQYGGYNYRDDLYDDADAGRPRTLAQTHSYVERAAWDWSAEANVGGNRERVYVTEPKGRQYFDKNVGNRPRQSAELVSERVAPSQKIVDTIWGPPPPSGGHTRMTLPHINWRQFGAPNYQTVTPVGPGESEVKDDRWQTSIERVEPAAVEKQSPKIEIPGQGELF